MKSKTLFLFDVDGTLTESRQKINEDIKNLLEKIQAKYPVAIISGSDLVKITEQLVDVLNFDFVFSEGGLICHKKGIEIYQNSISAKLGEDLINKVLNFSLRELSQIHLPVKRGNFIEYRIGMLNVSPIGRSCSQKERMEFVKYDQEFKVREKLVEKYRKEFKDQNISFSIGGQISIDIFPTGWDKRSCLPELVKQKFDKIYFFGDKTHQGGNDHELYNDSRVEGIKVNGPDDTIVKVENLIMKL
ncbi:hypothetical protein A3Q56_06638 [Intoshia linei]|uniref:Phosphomannomutase n=1 Tax=Intoshia linei TaxID=1819745 RepID=A0A177AWS6_9BILA|nr:hypothetical protein A3Q56_06638 [Intoshia linei]